MKLICKNCHHEYEVADENMKEPVQLIFAPTPKKVLPFSPTIHHFTQRVLDLSKKKATPKLAELPLWKAKRLKEQNHQAYLRWRARHWK